VLMLTGLVYALSRYIWLCFDTSVRRNGHLRINDASTLHRSP
jgi:hypothetical protein